MKNKTGIELIAQERKKTATNYCVGFMFNEKETDVLLIEKQKPDWQRGKFNGIGGKVEVGETSSQAMKREFIEETGVDTDKWKYIISIYGEGWKVDVFTCKTDDVFEAETIEKERVCLIPLTDLDNYNLISNLYWLIPMCLDKNDDNKSGINYHISNEHYGK